VKSKGVLRVRVAPSRFVARYAFLRHILTSALQESDLLEVVRSTKERNGDAPNGSQNSLPEVILRRNDFRSSTKLEALVQNLRRRLNIVQANC
jgi:hypothetical protein